MTLEQMLERYRDIKTELAFPLEQLASLEKQIKAHVKETGETCEIDGARITVRPGYTRVSWDTKKLEGFAAAHPELLALRSETQTAPAVSIKVD